MGKMRGRKEAWSDDIHLSAVSSNHIDKIRSAFPVPLEVMRAKTAEGVIADDCMFCGANIPQDGWSLNGCKSCGHGWCPLFWGMRSSATLRACSKS